VALSERLTRHLPAWLHNRNVQLLLSARVSMSVGRALASVVVPIYLAQLGFSGLELGVLFTAVALASGGLTALVGLLADRYGCKPFLILFPLLTGLAAACYLSTRAVLPIFVFSALGTIGRGSGAGGGNVGPYAPAEQAMLAATVEATDRSSAFGLMTFCSTMGALVGGVLAGLPNLARWLGARGPAAYRPAFLALLALCLATALLALPLADKRPPRARSHGRFVFPRRSLPLLARLTVTNSLNGLAIGAFAPFITLWFYERYGVTVGEIGVLYAVINLASAFPNLAAGRLARRFGLVRTVTFSRIGSAALLLVMVAMPAFWLAGAVYLVRMAMQRVSVPLRQSYVMGVAPEEERASVAGLSNLPAQATSAASPPLAGYLFDHVGIALPFVIGSAFQLANAVVYWRFFKNILPPEERDALRAGARKDDPAREKAVPEQTSAARRLHR